MDYVIRMSMDYVIRTALAFFVLALPVAGCGDDDNPPGEPSSGLLVAYQRSGGVAGVLEELRVQRSGEATVVVGPDRRRSTFTLGGAELEQLESDLDAADLTDPEAPPGDSGCADCFGYRIEYDGEEITWDDLDRPSQSLQAIAGDLGEIVADHHPPG